jgi:hypothetical protein
VTAFSDNLTAAAKKLEKLQISDNHNPATGRRFKIRTPPSFSSRLSRYTAISAQSGCVLDVTFNNAAREDNIWLVETVQQGKIGAIELIELEWLRTKPRPDKAWANN